MRTDTDNCPVVTPASGTLRVIQLTDTHLCREAGGQLLGMDTDHSLQAVIGRVEAEREGIDLVLGTGDISDKGAFEAYERAERYFAQLGAAFFWLPGNHDDRGQMEAAASTRERLSGEVLAGGWQILLLDSQIPGEVGGCLGESELARLDSALGRARDRELYTLVCLHHQPVAIGCEWLDEQLVEDADALWQLIGRYPGVRGVLWGHVHQHFDRLRDGVKLMASPSTCVQFQPGSVNFRLDDQPPGYRWLDLASDGTIDTGVSRVTGVSFSVDLDSHGYLD